MTKVSTPLSGRALLRYDTTNMATLAARVGQFHFFKGFGSVVAFFPRSTRYALDLPDDRRSTTETLADDWRAVFGDLRKATTAVDRELSATLPETKVERAT